MAAEGHNGSLQPLDSYFKAMADQGVTVVKELPRLDLDLYISNYKGRTRFDRLLHIGRSSVPLCIDALKAAMAEAKKGKDIQRYHDAWECLNAGCPDDPEVAWDKDWVDRTERANTAKTARLEGELKSYKNNLIKESIRVGHRDLGEHLEATGDLKGATDAYTRMRPEASTQSHITDTTKRLTTILVQRRDWQSVQANAARLAAGSAGFSGGHSMAAAEAAAKSDPEKIMSYAKMVSAIALLHTGDYAEAAKAFLQTGPVADSRQHSDICSAEDIATYGGLLALATMDRSELQSSVLQKPAFRNYLELVPHLRKAITMFVNARYPACLQLLATFRTDYLIDLHLQKHMPALEGMIRKKCIVHYLAPYSCVTFERLEQAFGNLGGDGADGKEAQGQSLQEELLGMIRSGMLDARLNTIDKVLETPQKHERAEMQARALKMAHKFHADAQERLRRMNVVAANLDVKGSNATSYVSRVVAGIGGSMGIGSSATAEDWLETQRLMVDD